MSLYSFEIPNEKTRLYSLISQLMLLINLLAFLFVIFKTDIPFIKWIACIGSIANIAAVIIYKMKGKPAIVALVVAFIISGICWALYKIYLPAFLLCFFAVFAVFTHQKFIIRFTDEGIFYPSFPSKIFLWNSVEQAMLKDGILTIDLKDNRLLQFSIDKKMCLEVDENVFNAFCKKQIK